MCGQFTADWHGDQILRIGLRKEQLWRNVIGHELSMPATVDAHVAIHSDLVFPLVEDFRTFLQEEPAAVGTKIDLQIRT